MVSVEVFKPVSSSGAKDYLLRGDEVYKKPWKARIDALFEVLDQDLAEHQGFASRQDTLRLAATGIPDNVKRPLFTVQMMEANEHLADDMIRFEGIVLVFGGGGDLLSNICFGVQGDDV